MPVRVQGGGGWVVGARDPATGAVLGLRISLICPGRKAEDLASGLRSALSDQWHEAASHSPSVDFLPPAEPLQGTTQHSPLVVKIISLILSEDL